MTILAVINGDTPIGYGHLDPEGNKVWLGICVSDKWQGKGIGKLMMNRLIDEAKIQYLPALYLTVDAKNIAAIKLYQQFGFHEYDRQGETIYFRFDLVSIIS